MHGISSANVLVADGEAAAVADTWASRDAAGRTLSCLTGADNDLVLDG